MTEEKKVVGSIPTKKVILSCVDGQWSAVFKSKDDSFFTLLDLPRLRRALKHGYRQQLSDVRIKKATLKFNKEKTGV